MVSTSIPTATTPGGPPAGRRLTAGTLAFEAGRVARVAAFGLPPRLNRHLLIRLGWTAEAVDPADPPWCPPGGASWVVHGDPAALVGGFLSLWLQALHPLALSGVLDHSTFEEDPLGRLQRTGSFVTATTFCPGSHAGALCARVRSVHVHVRGTAPDGRPYRAGDPALLDWVHCALLLAIARCWLRYGRDPDPGLLDAYVAEQARVPRELGDPDPPTTWAGLLSRVDEHRRDLVADDRTRAMRDWLAHPGLRGPLAAGRPAYRVVHAAAVAAAPDWALRLHGLDGPPPRGDLAGRALCGLLAGLGDPRRTRPRVPPGVAAA